jgi:MFS family permease
MADPSEVAALRRIIRPVYLPTFMNGIAISMLVPVLPLYLRDAGLSLSATATVLSAAGLGSIFGGLPAGLILVRLSEKQVQSLALATMAITVATLGWITATLALLTFRLAFGLALVAFRLALQSRVRRVVATRIRGRTMAYLGGSSRMAFAIGPVLGGLILDLTNFETTFAVCGGITLLGLIGSIGQMEGEELDPTTKALRPGVIKSMRLHGRRLLRAGFGCSLVVTAREGRYVVLPLIADDLGLSPSAVGALITVGTSAELILFPVSGHLMDRYGRLFAIVPAFSLMSIGLALLAAAHTSFMVGVASIIIGLGNGLSSGTLRTISNDLAPVDSPAPFLAGMLALQDAGRVLGPLVVGVTADAIGLSGSTAVLAIILVLGIAHLVFVVGETSSLRADVAR